MKTVAVSGGFDPLHLGHIKLFEAARRLGDRLVVIINNDHWVQKKKGYVFMKAEERAGIIRVLRAVDDVLITSHPANPADMSVNAELEKLKPDIFANGGDRKPDGDPVPEVELCKRLGIEMVYNVGGGKIQSSSELVGRVKKSSVS